MPLYLSTTTAPGKTLFATLERLSDGTTWNAAVSAWQAAPSVSDARIGLAAGTGIRVGSYAATVSGLGDAGAVRVRVHDDGDAADKVLGVRDVFIKAGDEVVSGVATPVIVGANQDKGGYSLSSPQAYNNTGQTSNIPAQVKGMDAGTVTAVVVATNAIDADAIAPDAVSEIQAGLATSANVAAIPAAPTASVVAAAVWSNAAGKKVLSSAAGKWVKTGDSIALYDTDGATVLVTLTLAPAGGPYTSATPTP